MRDLLLENAHLIESQNERIAELEAGLKSWEEQYKEQYIFAEQLRERTLRDHDKIIELEKDLAVANELLDHCLRLHRNWTH